jgi:hypothetical protein
MPNEIFRIQWSFRRASSNGRSSSFIWLIERIIYTANSTKFTLIECTNWSKGTKRGEEGRKCAKRLSQPAVQMVIQFMHITNSREVGRLFHIHGFGGNYTISPKQTNSICQEWRSKVGKHFEYISVCVSCLETEEQSGRGYQPHGCMTPMLREPKTQREKHTLRGARTANQPLKN